MKLLHNNQTFDGCAPLARTGHSSSERGMITILFMALLVIMMILIMVETSSLMRLRREVKLLEQQQTRRLSHETNPAPATIPAKP